MINSRDVFILKATHVAVARSLEDIAVRELTKDDPHDVITGVDK